MAQSKRIILGSGKIFATEFTGATIPEDSVIETADKYDIAMCFTGARLFHH